MHKRVFLSSVFLVLCLFGNTQEIDEQNSSAAFSGKGSKQFLIGLGLNEHQTWYPENLKGPKGHWSPLTGALTFQGEFGVHKYVGVGFTIGVQFSRNLEESDLFSPLISNPYSQFWTIGIPVGVIGNFHFFQLIADKSGKDIHQDQLDIYAGFSLGSGPSFAIARDGYTSNGNDIGVTLFGGPHVGIRFYPKSNVGVYLEAGYGKSYLNGGLAIKF